MVVGLGNPGAQYQDNRHNVGFMVVDAICEQEESLSWRPSQRFSAEIAKGTLRDQALLLAKPQTYMNLSGRSVAPLARFYRTPPERLLVVHDDVDLELGRLMVKPGGGDAGHKGIRSIIQELGSSEFIRIRFGVGRPELGDVTDHVLKDFRPEELEPVKDQVKRAGKAARTIIGRGLTDAMNRFNRSPKKKTDPPPQRREENDEESTKEQNDH